ncbi:hypothetical protein AVEN_135671-1 [Araneus ventricosus]|uniref:Uncharacterized protein n=1 Tax=Araneus ventricosus TaxID=182803 RepID=A0A4Y2QRF6_ARAVE|nr:hypothetical protein AVEN_135671-1 [Araneus ventricosus]
MEKPIFFVEEFIGEPKVSLIADFLLQHVVRVLLLCIEGNLTEKLTNLNLVWKQVKAVVPETVLEHSSYFSSNCNTVNGNPGQFLDRLLDDINFFPEAIIQPSKYGQHSRS